MKKKPKKKFVAIGKHYPDTRINPEDKRAPAVFIKHWTNNIENWLQKEASKFSFTWINFYYNKGDMKGKQFKSWTKNKGLYDNFK